MRTDTTVHLAGAFAGMENKNMKKMAGFAAAVFLGLMLTSCQGTQKAEQSGYKVFCRNAEATALREV